MEELEQLLAECRAYRGDPVAQNMIAGLCDALEVFMAPPSEAEVETFSKTLLSQASAFMGITDLRAEKPSGIPDIYMRPHRDD
jgi:hypothetical protein